MNSPQTIRVNRLALRFSLGARKVVGIKTPSTLAHIRQERNQKAIETIKRVRTEHPRTGIVSVRVIGQCDEYGRHLRVVVEQNACVNALAVAMPTETEGLPVVIKSTEEIPSEEIAMGLL